MAPAGAQQRAMNVHMYTVRTHNAEQLYIVTTQCVYFGSVVACMSLGFPWAWLIYALSERIWRRNFCSVAFTPRRKSEVLYEEEEE